MAGCRVEQAKCLAQLAGLVPNHRERERFLLGKRRILGNVIHPFLCAPWSGGAEIQQYTP